MNDTSLLGRAGSAPDSASSPLATDCSGWDFWAVDRGVRDLVSLYLDPVAHAQLAPHLERLGRLAGGRLDEIARIADRNGPVLRARDRFGRDEDWIEYHPAYREMERIAFSDFQFHAMVHRPGVLGMDRPLPAVAKYAFQYLFVQAEFGIMCPISVSDTSIHLIRRYGSEELKAYLLPKMLSGDMATLWKGTQFMTEKAAGSDVGRVETVARNDSGTWRLYGEKWFCSHTDAEVALMLARPEAAPEGTAGLALFACPRYLEDGSRNSYRIVRLKDKMGTRSMASGEIRFEGAKAYLVGDVTKGLKQMMDQVNLSRLSHGVRAAAMMRRCLNEAIAATRSRVAFGRPTIEQPLMRRQLMKLLVPTEQALSMAMLAAATMDAETAGDNAAKSVMRILTPLAKLRACRDNIRVATGAMEARGGNGYIEEWVNARLVRDAHIGVLWEGTSNINAIDVVRRAVGKSGSDETLDAMLRLRIEEASALPASFRGRLDDLRQRTLAFARNVARDGKGERHARLAATALYNITTAVQLAWEGTRPGFDARRALISRFVVEHRLEMADPLRPRDDAWEAEATDLLLVDEPVRLDTACRLLAA
ncbi:MAG: acyl-CoA dehydrogenase family protein [Hyphomicrobiaceae bacterium]|nr:acyl-CoA dehydrogenase family protein [Hyphomicrobiaceae bacterium]